MIPLGVGEIVGSITIGQIIDKYGMKVGIICCGVKMGVAVALVFSYVAALEFSVFSFIFPFFWGL
jgi:predicted MFS family arabinose efflux permease